MASVGKSMICGKKLKSMAEATGCWTAGDEAVLVDLVEGADIGCRGKFRAQSHSKNAESAFLFPQEITDAIASWITKGFAKGPFDKPEEGAKVNGIMCRQKPNGSARIILNLSAPIGESVNDGICAEDFPAVMSSTAKWLEVLDRAGQGALMMKADWSDAYKHVAVRSEDIKLQWFSWLGKYFAELCLVFGTASSVGIFDRAAKLVLRIVLRYAQFPESMVCQHLDDVCAASSKQDADKLHRLEKVYRMVAESDPSGVGGGNRHPGGDLEPRRQNNALRPANTRRQAESEPHHGGECTELRQEILGRADACLKEATLVLAHHGESFKRALPHTGAEAAAAGMGAEFLYRFGGRITGRIRPRRRRCRRGVVVPGAVGIKDQRRLQG